MNLRGIRLLINDRAMEPPLGVAVLVEGMWKKLCYFAKYLFLKNVLTDFSDILRSCVYVEKYSSWIKIGLCRIFQDLRNFTGCDS